MSCGLQQLLSDPTHLPNSSSCINLNFTDQSNLIVDSGVYPSLQPNCHHQISYCRCNVTVEYPPLYERLVWDYKKVDIESIKEVPILTNWDHLFLNKDVHQ